MAIEATESEWAMIPMHCREGLRGYLERGQPVGGFLTCLLTNDLTGAVTRADSINVHRLRDYVLFLTMHAPDAAWGSRKKVDAWLAKHKPKTESPDAD